MPSHRKLAPLALLAAALAACSNGSMSGTTSGGGAPAGGAGGTGGAGAAGGAGGTGGVMTGGAGGGGSPGEAPHGCQEYAPSGDPDTLVDSTVQPASPVGLAWDGAHYEALYTGQALASFEVFLSVFDPLGAPLSPPVQGPISPLDATAFGGSIVSAGDRRGAIRSDMRTGDYEIYFAQLGENGAKLSGDLQVTNAQAFSINPDVAWTGKGFLAVWQDQRNVDFHVFGQRIGEDGAMIGGNVEITKPPMGTSDEAPRIAAGPGHAGVVYISDEASGRKLIFRVVAADLGPSAAPPVTLADVGGQPNAPSVVWNFDRYVIAWQDLKSPTRAIQAAAIGPDGAVLTPTTQVTDPGADRSRAPALLALGDSLLLVYADDRDQNSGYELYARTLSPALAPLSAEIRVTNAPGDSMFGVIAAGPGGSFGDVGIFFRDDRAVGNSAFFTRLTCKTAGP